MFFMGDRHLQPIDSAGQAPLRGQCRAIAFQYAKLAE
jgi:hypothetical protein